MTDATYGNPHTPLGVGRIIGDTFSILFRKLPAILSLAFVPALVEILLLGSVFTEQPVLIDLGSVVGGGEFVSTTVVPVVVNLIIGSIVTAAIVQLSYDAKLNRPTRMRQYIASAIRNLPVVFVLSVVTTIIYGLGFAALVVPGLWLVAVFSVFVPAIVIEGEGYSALGRSAELTKTYRWPILGGLLVVILCEVVLTFVAGAAAALVASAVPAGSLYVAVILEAAASAVGYGALSVATALIFARLKEIKEGVSVSDLVEVFR